MRHLGSCLVKNGTQLPHLSRQRGQNFAAGDLDRSSSASFRVEEVAPA